MSTSGVTAKTLGIAFKTFFSLARNGLFADAFKQVGEIGKDLMHFVGFGFYVAEVYDVATRKDLSPRQKIIPLLGYGFATVASFATGVAVCAAATLAIPPLMFIASVANVGRNIGIYFKERAERNNLRKYFKEEAFKEGGEIKGIIDKIKWSQHTQENAQLYKESLNSPNKEDHKSPDLATSVVNFLQEKHFDANKIQELYVRLAYDYINDTKEEQEKLSDLLRTPTEGLTSEAKNKLREDIKAQEKKLKDEFAERYKPLFELLEKKQRLHRVEKSLNGRLANIFISAGVSLLSLLAMAIPMAMAATPAAPAAPLVYSILAGVSGGLGVVAGLNAGRMALQDHRSAQKALQPKEKVSEAAFPTLEGNRSTPEMAERSKVLYKRSRWQKIKDGISSRWERFWNPKTEASEVISPNLDDEMVRPSTIETEPQITAVDQKVEKPTTPPPTIVEDAPSKPSPVIHTPIPLQEQRAKSEQLANPRWVMGKVIREMKKDCKKELKRSSGFISKYRENKENVPPFLDTSLESSAKPLKDSSSDKPKI